MPGESGRDPREVLAREKYFSLRPRPLEQWMWKQGVPPSAERVFWLHWQEGMRNRDWCSEIPLRRVAEQCSLDVSSVTRAYQALAKLGLVRRQDPGRDPARPFEQAIAITEVRVPRELVQELDRYPARLRDQPRVKPPATPPQKALALAATITDPFAGLSGRERMRAIAALLGKLSANERRQYDEALRTHQAHLNFDADSKLTAEERGRVLQFLTVVAPKPLPATAAALTGSAATASGPRKLSVFELARLRREVQALTDCEHGTELLREVLWSVEQGALRRFTTLHAVRIALKKIREGAWTRPNRMPPNWSRQITTPLPCQHAEPETCRSA